MSLRWQRFILCCPAMPSLSHEQNSLLVLRTELGEAALLANGVDEMSDERILGTVAGANTLLIVCRDQEAAIEIQNEILGMMQ